MLAAFAAFLLANLIHNEFGLDAAILPAGIVIVLLLWRALRSLLAAAALTIGVPAFAFLEWSALIQTSNVHRLLNHLALLAGGVLAVVALTAEVILLARAAALRFNGGK